MLFRKIRQVEKPSNQGIDILDLTAFFYLGGFVPSFFELSRGQLLKVIKYFPKIEFD
ncbi:hypothetical protein [Marinilactibacillus sp. Marseille-P9653]|uniref:hypothetical protein n=1 Tax=Marinilactibacillus sp. Marseille-P9653 TaxID=2866583 RepID=UPI001CE47138|nr:hypothetical protein [Marinilactibacillus sp. Marseille-P9653]